MNIYKRIGECLESTGVIDSVLAYDAEEEQVLIQAGFIRIGTISVNNEIIDVYQHKPKKRTFYLYVDDDITDSSELFIEELKNKIVTNSDKPYLNQWK